MTCNFGAETNGLVEINGVCQSEFIIACTTLTEDYNLSDEEYRRFIKVKTLFNLNDYSYGNIQCILDYLFDGDACLVDIYSDSIKVMFRRCLSIQERALLLLYERVLPTQLFKRYEFLEVAEGSAPVIVTCDLDSECVGGGFVCDPNDFSSIIPKTIAAPCYLGDPERLSLPPSLKDTQSDIYIFQGQAIESVNLWKLVELYGEVPTFSLSGQPKGVYVDTIGNLKGYVRNTNAIGTYTVTFNIQTSAGTASTNFNMIIEEVNAFDTCKIKPSLILEKYENAPAKVTLGYQNSSNGERDGFQVYGENLRTTLQTNTTTGEEEIVEKPIVVNGTNLCSLNINMFALDDTSLPNTTGDAEYELELCFEGDTTSSDPFNNFYTGNNKYSVSTASDKFFDVNTNSTRYGFSLSVDNLPCGLSFGLDIAACFGGSICETVRDGIGRIGNTSVIDRDDNIPGFESLTFGFN